MKTCRCCGLRLSLPEWYALPTLAGKDGERFPEIDDAGTRGRWANCPQCGSTHLEAQVRISIAVEGECHGHR